MELINVTESLLTSSVTWNHTIEPGDGKLRFDPFEFIQTQPALSIILIIVLVVASVVGTCGNILILVSVATQRDLQNVESVFIINLAMNDLYVTMIADPLSIVGKTVGWKFFEDWPGLCRVIACLCTVSCVGSLCTLTMVSCNRYILICHQNVYRRLFTVRNSVLMCLGFLGLGILLVVLNFFGVGGHSFDHKSLECIWDRMADHNYTIVFAVAIVLLPIVVTGLAYLKLYLHVTKSRKKIHNHGHKGARSGGSTPDNLSAVDGDSKDLKLQVINHASEKGGNLLRVPGPAVSFEKDSGISLSVNDKPSQASNVGSQGERRLKDRGSSRLRLARALFVIYLVFSACWIPFALLIALDSRDTFSHEVHVIIVAWAHLHPSLNWLVYYYTHSKFKAAFDKLLRIDKWRLRRAASKGRQ